MAKNSKTAKPQPPAAKGAKASKANKAQEGQRSSPKEDLQVADLSHHAEMSYLEYAMSVVKGRAIPFVEDGLKPVHRRILFAMRELGLANTTKPKKSARVVGDCIGKYHPHGDMSVYEAMVRTAQSFSLRYPLVIGEGNFGSRDGDPAAAMRYTEARLAPIADTLLSELEKGTVEFVPTYDNSMIEPRLMPARLPLVILNGGDGIGVGIATDLPPHNLVEAVDACIALIRQPKSTLKEIMQILPGPDYPTGGQIISPKEEIERAYQDGKGSVRLRCKHHFEGEGTRQWKLVVDELPYGASSESIMRELDALINPKPKEKAGKKIFTPEQIRLKNLFTDLIEKFTDASDKESAIRLVIEPKTSKIDPQDLLSALLAYTSMEKNCSINMVVVGRDKAPRQKNLIQIMKEWTDFRVETVEKRTRWEHDQASKRLHILQGRLSILDRIEEVIKVLKNSEKPKEDLIARFKLSEIQAEDVLEMRLRQIAKLERIKIQEEIARLKAELDRLGKLLASRGALKTQTIKELEADKKLYGDARRTLIKAAEQTKPKAVSEMVVSDDPVTVAISERGWIRAKLGHQHDESAFAFKSGDSPKDLYKARLSDYAIFLDEAGKCYSIQLHQLPSAKGGEDVPIATLSDFQGRKLSGAFVAPLSAKALVASDGGYGFICQISDMVTRMTAGKNLLTLPEGWKPIPPLLLPDGINPEKTAFGALSSNNRLLVYKLAEINQLPKGKGVALIGLDDDAKLSQCAVLTEAKAEFSGPDLRKPIILQGEEFARHVQGRSASKKGKPVHGAKSATLGFVKPAPARQTEA